MCNSQGNLSLTEPDDNFCAIGIVTTTLNTIYEGFSLMPMNFVISGVSLEFHVAGITTVVGGTL